MKEYQSLSHTRRNFQYHIVFYRSDARRKYLVYCGGIGEMFRKLALHKESKIVKGHMMGDHVQMCLSTLPKYAVSNVVGYLKEKSALQIARKYGATEELHGGALLGSRIFCLDGWGLDENLFEHTSAARKRRMSSTTR